MQINWNKPNLNSQVKHFNLTLTLQTFIFSYMPYVNISNYVCNSSINSTFLLVFLTDKNVSHIEICL